MYYKILINSNHCLNRMYQDHKKVNFNQGYKHDKQSFKLIANNLLFLFGQ